MIQILRIKEKIRALSYNSPKLNLKSNYRDDVNEQFENLYSSFDDLIQDDGIRARIFVELKNLYTDMWETIKSFIQMRKQQKTLNIDSNPVENNSLNEFLFLSPKGNFTHSLAISSIEKDTTNNFASFKSSGNLLGQNTANIPKQTENIQSSTNKNETRLSFHQALKSMKEKIESNREYQTESLESAEKFVFQSPSDNNESTYLKETLYPYTSKLTENRSKGNMKVIF